ncbi:hypothetical protein A2713_02400 [candidate division WWE3 bacterium RIFCSPHIGHO2_01_FULL_35_17]|uniref:Uncharacterized protein n=1 Tax=candidate division WWE3 bacterium RIFCSPHIGHO2_01_FULL_35_17 TaxID=1802614 RepID=A0A1F4USK5_UNCKA|nr:MAG: hypothetical protein A2713_02400 [candidate division WWE3 bacterium RIFCSPHIGHO2_01_FULL_35_17]
MLTIKEVANRLGVHWQTVRNYIDKKELKSYKVGRLVKVKEEDLENFLSKQNDTKDEKYNIEIELRYFVENRKSLEKKILDIGGIVNYHGHIIDHWFIPNHIKNREDHDIWFNKKRGTGIRIREQDNGYTGKITTSLEAKKLTSAMNHNTFLESEISVENYQQTRDFLELLDRKEFITIDKDRVIYKIENFKIVIDDIKNFRVGVEIEIENASTRDEAIKNIEGVATKLGLGEKNKTPISITVSAMDTLAKF